jgi:glycerol-3-phosphate dehydrogenase
MSGNRYDIVVVGGGINGVAVAQAAAAAGYRILLLEKSGLASGTSSKSSKLIHGGLRYLESWEFGLVRESLGERRLMLELAPGLVRLQKFYIPVYPTTRRRPWIIRCGLLLYALLGGPGKDTRFRTLPRNEWQKLTGLDKESLQTVFEFRDAQTDDLLLTRAVMRSATELGADARIPAEMLAAELRPDGVELEYRDGDQRARCTTRVLVNAAGPWAPLVLERIRPEISAPPVELIQGTHIVVPRMLTDGVFYVESPRDGRAVFVMPRNGNTLVGTTETRFDGNPDQVRPLETEIRYLLNVFNHYFPDHSCTRADIASAFAGLRVLPSGGGHAFHRSREVVLATDRRERPRVLSILGGKLTTWRPTAGKVLREIASSLPPATARADTRKLVLRPE